MSVLGAKYNLEPTKYFLLNFQVFVVIVISLLQAAVHPYWPYGRPIWFKHKIASIRVNTNSNSLIQLRH